MYRHPQVKGLVAPACAVPVGKAAAHAVQDMVPLPQRLANDQVTRALQGLAYFFTTRHLTDAGMARTVGQQQQIACEKWTVRTAQIQQHAVAARHWNHPKGSDAGGMLVWRCVL